MTDRSHKRSTEVEHVLGHATENDVVIMEDRVTDHAAEAGHATEVDHVKEADHDTEAGRVTETDTVVVGVTGISTKVVVEAEAEAVTVIGESVTMSVTVAVRKEKGYLPRFLGELAYDKTLFKVFKPWLNVLTLLYNICCFNNVRTSVCLTNVFVG